MIKYINTIIQYVRLIRFRYHISFIFVILGAFIFSSQPFYTLIKPLIIVYLSFNVLLYGGLYTLNDIADAESDSKHPRKKNRPLASKSISIKSAYIFAFVLIFLGLIVAYFCFGASMFFVYLSFIFINLFYTHIAKKIPYAEILFNSLSHPMRFFLGVLLVTDKIPYLLLVAVLLIAFGIASSRRVIERRAPGKEARRTLQYYTDKKLLILQIIPLCLIVITAMINYPFYAAWYAVDIVLYFIFVFGIYLEGPVFDFYKFSFLN